MSYSAIVLRNISNGAHSVDYAAVTDALLSGGIALSEVVLLSYDSPLSLSSALIRLSSEHEGVFLICDKVLLPYARDAVSARTGLGTDTLLTAEGVLYAVIPAGKQGAEIVQKEVIPAVDKQRGKSYSRVVVCAVSAPADKLKEAISSANEAAQGKLILHAGEKYGCARIEVIYDNQTPKMTVDEVVRLLAEKLEPYVYALEDMPVAQRLFDCLSLHRLKIATAESFTAGGVGQALVRIPGASKVFYEGLNTYDNGSKIQRLGVSEYTLKSKGAVSSDVAYEMAAGLLAQGKCDVSVATTGIAGPTADGSDKPVGLCYIAVGTKEHVRVFRFRLEGDRETVTQTAVNLALFLTYKEIK